MGEVLQIGYFPLAGAQAVNPTEAVVGPAGIEGDRMYTLYRSAQTRQTAEGETVCARYSQKQNSNLARVCAPFVSHEEAEHIFVCLDGERFLVPVLGAASGDEQLYVDEFGDAVPIIDAGDAVAAKFSQWSGIADLRLGQKTNTWMRGTAHPSPEARRVAPLHIIFQETLETINELGSPSKMELSAARFRPNLVLGGVTGSFEEEGLVGRTVWIGELAIRFTRLAERCSVPGIDQRTGEQKADVQRFYPHLIQHPQSRKPTFGLYGIPVFEEGTTNRTIRVGDEVSICEAA